MISRREFLHCAGALIVSFLSAGPSMLQQEHAQF